MLEEKIRRFLFPSLSKKFLIRVGVVALAAYIFFGHICIPLRIRGESMAPTYINGSFNFCWRVSYVFSKPQRFDVVAVRFAGTRIMLLKRIVALAGEQVEFKHGSLFVNGQKITEPHLHYPSDWILKPRTVAEGSVYVVGDNRSTSIRRHHFGQTPVERIMGKILW